ncbi:MAG: S-layer homology domain-containing protein [Butyricicoccus pullicaecorum]|nr:S-layer homology domain-containing protein [Butyricicoccus pullicaecorum]
MKNLKKVLAMVLAFACTFSMFAGAKVFEDVPAGSDYSEAITMLSDLGIIQGKDDGKYHPEDTITRAEACAMIARLMTGDPNVSQYVGAQSFTDVAKGSWKDSAIGYCYINGIVIGVGNNKFEPDRAITDAEFITMVVRAMGYETADMKQNYPFSYMSNAQAIGLLDGTNMVASTDALRGEDAQVIYNALFADYARGAKLVNTTHGTSVETYPTLAESVWGLERAAVGTWKDKDDETATLEYCKAHTWVVLGADPTAEGHILAYAIEDDSTDLYTDNKDKMVYSFKYEGDADAVAGYQVELWGEGSHGEPEWESKNDKYVWSDNWEIKAIKTVKGQKAYDYNASMADSKRDNGEIVIGEETLKLDSVADNANDAEKVQSVDQYLYEGYHGETKLDKKKVEKALNIRDGAQYKLVDWDSDGDIDWAVVSTANYYKVDSVSSKRLTVSYMQEKDATNEEENTTSKTLTWKLNDLNDEKDYKLKVVAPEDLAEGDVIEVTYTTAYDKSEKAEVVTATVTKVEADTHELDKVSTKDNLVLTFDGETMELAQNKEVGDTIVPANPSKYIGFDEEELGTEFNIWTDRNGFIVYSDYATESTNYMMVLDTADGSDKTGDRKQGVIDFISADNKLHKDVKLTSSARVLASDGRTETGAYDDGDRTFDESKIVGNVYKYWTNEDGEITKMQEIVNDEKSDDYDYVAKNDRLTLENGESYALEDADVIFAVIGNYIKDEGAKVEGGKVVVDLKVDSGDVLAVKQSDIPDIKENGDTEPEVLDAESTEVNSKSWVDNKTSKIALSADKNKDVSAAVLGVDSFNKFNAGSTKVGLVTNVSYDKNDVVSIDVAYNGKVETISSAEKKDFDDIVSVMDYDGKNNTEEYSVGSRTETMNYNGYDGIMKGTNLKDYLNKSAAYAEITVDADGKLTDVMFMDEKGNDVNTVIGNYYQVSRKVITDVNEGKWISTYNGAVTYASKDALYSIDTKNSQTVASDFADEVFYYTIDGKPTRFYAYEGKALSILESENASRTNFDGNPDISVAEASDVEVSNIHNDADAANDTYYVADIASKIADDGKGDVVAVYMFEDDMDEVISLQGSVVVTASQVKVGEKTTVNVDFVRADSNIDMGKLYIDVVDKDGEKVLDEVKVSEGDNTVDTSKLAAGEYRVKLYGYNTANKADQLLQETRLVVSKLGVAGDVNALTLTQLDAKTVEVKATDKSGNAVEDLKSADFAVKVNGALMAASEYTVTDMGKGVYQIRANEAFESNAKVVVTVAAVDSDDVVVNPAEKSYVVNFKTGDAAYTGDVTLKINDQQVTVKATNEWPRKIVEKMITAINAQCGNICQAAAGDELYEMKLTSDKELSISLIPDSAATGSLSISVE